MTEQQRACVSRNGRSAEEPSDLRTAAVDNLKRRREFRNHLIVYVVVNAGLWAIWLITAAVGTGSWFPWPIFPTLGWGAGLAIHAWETYGRKPISEDEVLREMDRLRRARSA